MKDIKKFESVIFWIDGTMERGKLLDVILTEEGLFFQVENIRTHEMLRLRAELVFREEECK